MALREIMETQCIQSGCTSWFQVVLTFSAVGAVDSSLSVVSCHHFVKNGYLEQLLETSILYSFYVGCYDVNVGWDACGVSSRPIEIITVSYLLQQNYMTVQLGFCSKYNFRTLPRGAWISRKGGKSSIWKIIIYSFQLSSLFSRVKSKTVGANVRYSTA
jgi:hypothetical protein